MSLKPVIPTNRNFLSGGAIKTGRNLELFPSPEVSVVEFKSIKSAVRFYSTNIFHIGPQISRMYFKEFFLLYWSGDWIIESSKNNAGILNRNGKAYEIVYKIPLTRGKILARLDDQFMLSFREPFADYQLDNVVIVAQSRSRNA